MSHSPSTPLDALVAMKTDIGRKRKQNQDAIGHAAPPDPGMAERLGQIFVLADGVGGLSGGDLASQYAVSTIISSYYGPGRRRAAGAPGARHRRGQRHDLRRGQGRTGRDHGDDGRGGGAARDEVIIGSGGRQPGLPDDATRRAPAHARLHRRGVQRDPASPAEARATSWRGRWAACPRSKSHIISGRVRPRDHVELCSDA